MFNLQIEHNHSEKALLYIIIIYWLYVAPPGTELLSKKVKRKLFRLFIAKMTEHWNKAPKWEYSNN